MQYQPEEMISEKYQVIKQIGRGAFGEVYLVEHLALKCKRAIKVVSKEMPGNGSTIMKQVRERFQLEAQLGAQIDHPNVIRVHDFVALDAFGGTLILEMEYAPGGNLLERMQEGNVLPVKEVIKIGCDIAEGLAALHQLDIVHRDIKPENILFSKDGKAKIADLGLAQTPNGLSFRSVLGSVALPHPGTPGWMSPEQESTTMFLKPASDVYALGLVMFNMLTLRHYPGLRPGTRVKSLREDLPEWLDELIARILAKDPDERPWNGAEVRELLVNGQAAWETKRAQQGETEKQPKAEEERKAEVEKLRKQEQARQVEGKYQGKEEESRKAKVEKQHKTDQVPHTDAKRLRKKERGIVVKLVGIILAVLVLGELIIWGVSQWLEDGKPTPTSVSTTKVATSFDLPENAEKGDIVTRSLDNMDMVYVPAGDFLMGSQPGDLDADGDEFPQENLYVNAYWIDKYEVTNAQYTAFLKEMGNQVEGGENWLDAGDGDERIHQIDGEWYADYFYADYPVVEVSWYGAKAYCEWASGRLPTEAEWEKAARGEDGRTYPWGDESPNANLLNYNGNESGITTVGSLAAGASPYGALDMAGNVWEWTSSLYQDYPYNPNDGREDLDASGLRVLRGGSWNSSVKFVRAADRVGQDTYITSEYGGFRCVFSTEIP